MGMQRLAIAAVHGAKRLGAGGVNGAAGLIAPQQVQNDDFRMTDENY